MKKLVLLFFFPLCALALAACQSPPQVSQTRVQQLAEAQGDCAQTPSTDPQYGACLNRYLQAHYGWQMVNTPDGGVAVGFHHYAGTAAHY